MVCGLDKDHIVLQDPGIGGRRRISRDAFLNVSFDFKNMFSKASEDLIIKRLIIVTPTILSPASFRKLSKLCSDDRGLVKNLEHCIGHGFISSEEAFDL